LHIRKFTTNIAPYYKRNRATKIVKNIKKRKMESKGATHFTVKVFVVYGTLEQISGLMGCCIALEASFHYSGEYLYFATDPTELLNEHCPELGLKASVETWTTNCFNFQVVDE
jgi:hypothetical protein